MKEKIYSILITIAMFLTSCSTTQIEHDEVIVIKGSDTMLHLTEKLADAFSELHPNLKFHVFGGGTTSGIDKLLSGSIDICTASRNLTSLEAKKLAQYYGSIGMYYLIAKDAVSIYVNRNTKIFNLTFEQLKKIFTCSSLQLDSLNIGKGEIKLAIREAGSGTRKFLKNSILPNSDFCKSATEFTTTEDIIDFIKKHKNAIGFGGIGFGKGIRKISINGIKPNIRNAKSDRYPLTRYLHFFTSRSPSGKVKKFIDWVLSPDGQKIVKEEGFIPLWEINY